MTDGKRASPHPTTQTDGSGLVQEERGDKTPQQCLIENYTDRNAIRPSSRFHKINIICAALLSGGFVGLCRCSWSLPGKGAKVVCAPPTRGARKCLAWERSEGPICGIPVDSGRAHCCTRTTHNNTKGINECAGFGPHFDQWMNSPH